MEAPALVPAIRRLDAGPSKEEPVFFGMLVILQLPFIPGAPPALLWTSGVEPALGQETSLPDYSTGIMQRVCAVVDARVRLLLAQPLTHSRVDVRGL